MNKNFISQLKSSILTYYSKSSKREKILALISVLVLGSVAFSTIVTPIQAAFDLQSRRIAKAEQDLKDVNLLTGRLKKLKLKKDSVEEYYKKVEIKEGVRSYLENLLQNQARIPVGKYIIKPGVTRKLSTNYSQVSFNVEFPTEDITSLVNFLSTLTQGDHPLVLNKLEIDKSRRNDKFEVSLEVSNIIQNT